MVSSWLVRHVVLPALLLVLLLPVMSMVPDHTYQSGQAMKMVGNALYWLLDTTQWAQELVVSALQAGVSYKVVTNACP